MNLSSLAFWPISRDVSKSNRAAGLLVNFYFTIISIYYMASFVYLREQVGASGGFAILTSLAFPVDSDDFHKGG